MNFLHSLKKEYPWKKLNVTCHIYAKVAKLCFETFLSTQTNLLFSYMKYSISVNSEITAFQFSR